VEEFGTPDEEVYCVEISVHVDSRRSVAQQQQEQRHLMTKQQQEQSTRLAMTMTKIGALIRIHSS
jgi:hypothetical protein